MDKEQRNTRAMLNEIASNPQYPVTAASIDAAKRAQQAARRAVTDATGLVIEDEPEPFDSYTIICPNCLAPIGAESRGKADRAFAHHFVTAHRAHLRLA